MVKILSNTIQYLVWVCFIGVCFLVFFYIPWIHNYSYPVIILIGCIAILLALKLELVTRKLRVCPDLSDSDWLWKSIALGFALRVIWLYWVPPIQLSDAQDYLDMAKTLLNSGEYIAHIKGYAVLAWRPPGYSLFLAACMLLFGQDAYFIPAATNILFYILTSIITYDIAIKLFNKNIANISVLILSIWPSGIAITGLALAEPISLFLYTLSIWSFIKLHQHKGGWWFALILGVATGFNTLIKPALMLLPVLWILYHIVKMEYFSRSLLKTFLAIAFMILTIAPWSIRNYNHFHTFIAISTNGGDVFYRANNPIASGGYSNVGEKDLSIYLDNEVLWNKTGYQWGKEWIINNPLAFLKLMTKKQAIFLGEDTTGVYWSLFRGHNEAGINYQLSVLASDGWWVLVWLAAVIGAIKQKSFFTRDAQGALFLMNTLFFVVVHSVFESQPRYHMPMIALLVIIAASGIAGQFDKNQSVSPLLFKLARYIGVGGIGTAGHFLVLWTLVNQWQFNELLATTLGFVVGGLINYWLNYHFTFASKQNHQETAIKFFTIAILGMLLNGIAFSFFSHYFMLHYLISQLLSTILVLAFTFVLNLQWTFRTSPI